MRKPKDRDFVETVEGLLFCLIGYLHPPKGYTAYLKYVPEAFGRWSRGRVRYRRAFSYYHVMKVEETFGFLEKNYPEYLFQCPVRNILISTVPKDKVRRYYEPEVRLGRILAQSKRDELEEEVRTIAELLSDLSGVDAQSFGVTGSILLGTHNPLFSDVDLTVLGSEASEKLKDALIELKGERAPILREPEPEKRERWIRERIERFPLTREEAELFFMKRWNYGYFGKRYFSIHPIRRDEEITEEYGEKHYTPVEVAEGSGIVSSARESIFLPAVYIVEDVKAQTRDTLDLREVVSYEGLYSNVVAEGEQFRFRGLIERVDSERESYHRILIGSTRLKGSDYIKPNL